MLSTTVIFAGLATAITAIPTTVKRVDNTLPWEITWFNANKYSSKSHNARINITLSDPNETRLQQTPTGYAVFPKFEANCHWSWDWFEDPFPFDKVTVCTPLGSDDIYGNLTMTLRDIGEEEPSPGSVDVDIVESRSVIVLGTQYLRVWNGTLHLRSGENTRLRCALGSGQCGWNLQNRPVLVQPQLIESLGSCETADIGGC